MLKLLAVLAMAVVIAQTPAPIPGKGSDHPAGAGSTIEQQTGNGKGPPQPAPPLGNQNQSPSGNGDARNQDGQDKSNTVTVGKLPTVSISKDWADWSYWGFSGLLVAVGSLQVWLLWRTLGGMRRQADLMEGQLKEMRRAGHRAARQLALTENELEIAHRAYLAPGMPETALSGETRVPIENYGKIAARVISVRIQQMQYGKDRKEILKNERMIAVDIKCVSPGRASDYAIFFDTQPFTPEVLASAIGIAVEYDTGFGKTDTLTAVFSMHPTGGWTRGNTIFDSRTSEQENQKPN